MEALLLADLSHPNLPRIHDHFSENGRCYVVMDFIAGATLENYLNKFVRRLPVEEALEIGLQLSSVLDYLHNHQPPIIFRDLKPNIMRTADNHVYLIDFGIARHFKPGKAKDTIPLGSRGYAAPEQYGKAQSTPQSDIYGLGATLHQLLTGDDPSLTLFHFEPLRLRNSAISTQLNTFLQQMLEMEMSKRPASMAAVKQELQRFLAQQTSQRLSPSQMSSRNAVGRRRFLIGLVSTVAVCAGSSIITAFAFGKMNTTDKVLPTHSLFGNTPVTSSAPPTASPIKARIIRKPYYTYKEHAGSVTAVAWSSQGNSIASAGSVDSSVQGWDASTGKIVLIPTPEADATGEKLPVFALFDTNKQRVDGLAWSPDGRSIASAAHDVQLWDALAWKPIFTYTKHTTSITSQVQAVAWSPNGKYIASGGMEGTVQVWNSK